MHSVQIIDPNTGVAHDIPYDQLPNALEAGGQFADESQKQKAIRIQNGSYQDEESSIAETPFNPKSKPLELELTKAQGKSPGTMGWKGVKEDAIKLLKNSLKGLVGFGRRTPGNLKEIGSELIHHPLSYPPHISQQVLAGLTEGGKELVNIIPRLSQELSEKGITSDWAQIPSIPEDTGVEKFFGLEPTKKSDELLRAVPALYGGGKLLGAGAKKVGKVINRPSKEALFQRALEEKISKAAEKVGMSETDLKKFQTALKHEYAKTVGQGERLGEATPDVLQEKIYAKEHKLAAQKPLTEIPEQEIKELPPAPDTKAMLEKHQDLINEAKKAAEKHIGIKENPKLKAGEKVQKAITDLEKSSTDIYDAARDYYKDKNVSADNSAEIKAATDELESLKNSDELAPGYGSGTAEQKALEENIEALKGEKVNTSDIFSLMRTMQQLANKTRMKRKGATQLEYERLTKIADNLDSHADKFAKRLEEVGGQDVRKMIKQANKGYRTFKQLSKENPIGKAAMKGKIPNNALEILAETHDANDFLQALVNSDPVLRKHMLAAYTGEANLNKLTNPNTLIKGYIQSLPDVENHLLAFKKAVADYKPAEREANRVKAEHDALVKSMEDAAKEQKKRRDAIEESDKLEKQIKFKKEAIPKIEAKMKTLEADSAEHKALQKQLDEHKKFIQDKGGRLKELAKFFVKVKAVGKIKL